MCLYTNWSVYDHCFESSRLISGCGFQFSITRSDGGVRSVDSCNVTMLHRPNLPLVVPNDFTFHLGTTGTSSHDQAMRSKILDEFFVLLSNIYCVPQSWTRDQPENILYRSWTEHVFSHGTFLNRACFEPFMSSDGSAISILRMSTQDVARECHVLMKFNKLMSADWHSVISKGFTALHAHAMQPELGPLTRSRRNKTTRKYRKYQCHAS